MPGRSRGEPIAKILVLSRPPLYVRDGVMAQADVADRGGQVGQQRCARLQAISATISGYVILAEARIEEVEARPEEG
jgi:acetaldehyde dehydrogenase (acetylating)